MAEHTTGTGFGAVDRMAEISITGNVTPVTWYTTFRKPGSGTAFFLAVSILSDIVYWFRPAAVRDEETGRFVRWRSKL